MRTKCFFVLLVFLILLVTVEQQVFSSDDNVLPAAYTLLLSQELRKVTKLINAEHGGSLNLNRISLTIPPGALNEDTEITLKSVDVSQYDRDTLLGGVKNLHIIGAVFEPSDTVLNMPAVVRFSLPYNWSNDDEVVVSAANGIDPMEVLESAQEITITGSSGAYIAEIKIPHFSIFNVSRICHEGSVNNTVKKFNESNVACTEEVIKAQVMDKYNIPIDPFGKDKNGDAKLMGPDNIQAFLGTYFDVLGSSYNAGDEITNDTIEYMKERARNGQQVVIAFNLSETWPDRDGTHAHNFYRSFPHTANLEYHKDPSSGDETFLVRHTLSIAGFSGPLLTKLREKMGNVISYTDPLDNINNFRITVNGKFFREYVKNKWPGEFDELFVLPPKHYTKSYKSAKIYVDRRDNSLQNPCDLNLKDRQNCLCSTKCLLPGTQFSCRYDTEFMGWSPSCRDLNNGPCICTAYGCVRRQMVTSGDCYDNCMEQFPE